MVVKKKLKFNSMTLTKFAIQSNGYAKGDMILAKTGILPYYVDGKTRYELRHPTEVFKEDSLDSFKNLPITWEHPPGMLDSDNTKNYIKGYTGENIRANKDTGEIIINYTLTDKALIDTIKNNGLVEVSAGYLSKDKIEAGEYQGRSYDLMQTSMRGNHVSMTRASRSGNSTRLIMNSKVINNNELEISLSKGVTMIVNGIKYDSVQLEVQKAYEDAVAKVAKKDEEFSAFKVKFDSLTVKYNSLLKKDNSVEIDKAVNEKIQLLTDIRPIFDKAELKLDSTLSTRELKLNAIKILRKKDLEGKDDTYITPFYDSMIESCKADSFVNGYQKFVPGTEEPKFNSEDDLISKSHEDLTTPDFLS